MSLFFLRPWCASRTATSSWRSSGTTRWRPRARARRRTSRDRCSKRRCRYVPAHAAAGRARTHNQHRKHNMRQESVLRNFGEVGAGNLLSGMTVKHFNPIASIFIARKKLRGGGAASFARVPMPCQCALALHAGHVRSLSQCTIATRWRAGVNSFAAARLEKFTAQSGGQVSVENGT